MSPSPSMGAGGVTLVSGPKSRKCIQRDYLRRKRVRSRHLSAPLSLHNLLLQNTSLCLASDCLVHALGSLHHGIWLFALGVLCHRGSVCLEPPGSCINLPLHLSEGGLLLGLQAKDEELHITAKQLKAKVAELQEEVAALAAHNKALVLSSLKKRWVRNITTPSST